MITTRSTCLAAVLSCTVLAAPAAYAGTFDFGRLLDAGRDLVTATKGMDEKEEVLVGRDLAGQILGAAELVNDRALQVYVNRVGRWIAAQSERPNLPWHFGVVESPGINAFAAPGGYILITRGLYELLDNEAQLAGVLGHEIGHVLKRHHVDLMQKGNLLSAAGKGAQAYASSRGAAGTVIGNLVVPNVAEVFAKGLDRGAEYEADLLGVVLASRAGYSPSGLVEVLQKLQARSANDPSVQLLFATHPQPADRLQKIGEAVAPRVATLPEGAEPAITRISVGAPAARASRPMPAGARALNSEPLNAEGPIPGAATRGGGSGTGLTPDAIGPTPRGTIDPGGIFRGLMGR